MKTFHISIRRLSYACLFIAVAFNLIGLKLHFDVNFLNSSPETTNATLIWLFSIILLGIYIILQSKYFDSNGKKSNIQRLTFAEKSLFAIIVIFALLVRLYKINLLGLHLIESYWLYDAKNILHGAINPFGYMADFPSNILAFPIAFLGLFFKNNYLIVRLPVVMYSIFNIIFTFLFFRHAFNKKVAFISLVLLACSIWDINMQRVGWQNASIIPFLISANMFFLFYGLNSSHLLSIFISGIITGLAINTLYIPILIIFPSLFYIGFIYLGAMKKKTILFSLLMYLLTIFFVSSPNIAKFIKYPQFSIDRQKSSFILNYNRWQNNDRSNYYLDQTSIVLNNFKYNKEKFMNPGIWTTTLDPIVSVFLFIGILFCILKICSASHVLIFLNFLVMFIPIVIFDREGSTWREFGLITGIYMIASIGILFFLNIISKIFTYINLLLATKWNLVLVNKITLAVILCIYFIIFIDIYQNYSITQIINNQRSTEGFFQKTSQYIRRNYSKDNRILLVEDFPGKVISLDLSSEYKTNFISNIDQIDLADEIQKVIVFSQKRNQTGSPLDEKRIEELFIKKKVSYKKEVITFTNEESILIYAI